MSLKCSPRRLARKRPVLASLALLVISASGCADNDSGTRFGPADQVRDYRSRLNPIIDDVGALENEVTDRAVSTSNRATPSNLDTVYRDIRPQLLEALVELDRIEPPTKLRHVHDSIRQLILLRLDAYAEVTAAVAGGSEGPLPEAEEKLRLANDMIRELNETLCEIDIALGDLEDCRLLA